MPSPIAHSALALVVREVVARDDRWRRGFQGRPWFFYAAAVVTLCLPDIDFLLQRVFAHPSLSHGGATHSLAAGVLFGGLFALVCQVWYRGALPWLPLVAIGLVCAWSHALLDMATLGGGVMWLWPFDDARYSTWTLFYGVRHSQPWAWHLHAITVVTELMFAWVVWRLARGLRGSGGGCGRRAWCGDEVRD